MTKRWENTFKSFDETKIFYQGWIQDQAAGTIIITHGQGEHSESYHRLVDYFSKLNPSWNFIAWDLRGHGRSEGKRGYVSDFSDYTRDYALFLNHILHNQKITQPVILLSHSMGGLIQLKFMATDYSKEKYPQVVAQVCSSPLLGVAVPVPAVKDFAAGILASVMPKLTLWNEITYDMLTRDPEVIREFEVDALRHDQISSRTYLGFKENFEILANEAGRITLPTLFQIAEKDPVVSSPAAKSFFEKMKSSQKRIMIYGEGAKHEIYNDTHREEVYRDLQQQLIRWTQKEG